MSKNYIIFVRDFGIDYNVLSDGEKKAIIIYGFKIWYLWKFCCEQF